MDVRRACAGRCFFVIAGLQLLIFAPLTAQQAGQRSARRDTTGAPSGCSAAAGIAAITRFFAAFNDADSAGLAQAVSLGGFVFSTGKFTPREPFVRIENLTELVHYARGRTRRHDRMTVQQVKFNGWRGKLLLFGPIYFLRAADDLGPRPRPGIGQGMYRCGRGILVLGLAPRPGIDPGPRR